MIITEVKITPDGRKQKYKCQALDTSPSRMVLSHRWLRDKAYKDGPMELPAGEINTVAFYWSQRNYLLYRLSDEFDSLLGYRIDACEYPQFTKSEVSWRDLILDFWISSSLEFHVLDEPEFEAARKSSRLSHMQYATAVMVKEYLAGNFRDVIEEVELFMARKSN